MKNKCLSIIFSLFSILPNSSNAENLAVTAGKIGDIFTNSLESSTVAARGYTEFKLEGVDLLAPCLYLYINPDDKNTLSVILMAKTLNKTITIQYLTDITAPWSAGDCAVQAISFN